MTRRASRWAVVTACFATAVAIAYLTFVASWNQTPRLVWAIVPGAYIAAAINKILHLPTTGAGMWYLFFITHILVWFAAALATACAVAGLKARWRARHRHGIGGVA
jgi:hypothetical protein